MSDVNKVKVSYYISPQHRDTVLAVVEMLSREYGVKVQIGDALEKIIDASLLTKRSLEGSNSTKEIEPAVV